MNYTNLKGVETAIRRAKDTIETNMRTIRFHEEKINELTNKLGDVATEEEREMYKKEIKKHVDFIKDYLNPGIKHMKERLEFLEGTELPRYMAKMGGRRKHKASRKTKRTQRKHKHSRKTKRTQRKN